MGGGWFKIELIKTKLPARIFNYLQEYHHQSYYKPRLFYANLLQLHTCVKALSQKMTSSHKTTVLMSQNIIAKSLCSRCSHLTKLCDKTNSQKNFWSKLAVYDVVK